MFRFSRRSEGTFEQDLAHLVEQEVLRITASPGFLRSLKLCKFLRFIVEATLNGDTDALKETTIGTAVFEREVGYDPKTEPIVRIEARRLRQKLEEYNAGLGAGDPVLIHVPKGGYVPEFEIRQTGFGTTQAPVIAEAASHGLRVWAVLAGAIVAVAGIALVLAKSSHPSAPLIVTPLTSYSGSELRANVSPDGRQFAFVWDGETHNFDIYVRLIGTGNPVRITSNPAHDLNPVWSPDGRQIAFVRSAPDRQDIVVVPALGGAERIVSEIRATDTHWVPNPYGVTHVPGPSWSPDGNALAYADKAAASGSDCLFVQNLQTGRKRQVTYPKDSDMDSSPAFSPKGDAIAFARTSSESSADVYVQWLAAGSTQRLTFDNRDVAGISWTPDGKRLVFSSNRIGGYRLWQVSARGGSVEPIYAAGRNVLFPNVSLDGHMLVFTELVQNTGMWSVAVNGGHPRRLSNSSKRDNSAHFSPDGNKLAFVSDRSGNWEIWTCDADGSDPEQLTTFNGHPPGTPRWSPDGRQLVFDLREGGHSSINVIDARAGTPRRLTNDAMMPSWSRDGRWIYSSVIRNGVPQLWKSHVDGGGAVRVTEQPASEAMESEDGRTLYFVVDAAPGIWSMPVEGGAAKLIPELAQVPWTRYWTVTRDGIYFAERATAPAEIRLYDFQKQRTITVARIEKDLIIGTNSLAVSPRDRSIVYGQADEFGSDILLLKNFR